MPEQFSSLRRAAKGIGGIFVWGIVSTANGAFVAAFISGVFNALKYPNNEVGLWLKLGGIPVAVGTFSALLWWRWGDGSFLWPIMPIAIGPLVAVFLLMVASAHPDRLLPFAFLILIGLPVATGIVAGVRWWRKDHD